MDHTIQYGKPFGFPLTTGKADYSVRGFQNKPVAASGWDKVYDWLLSLKYTGQTSLYLMILALFTVTNSKKL